MSMNASSLAAGVGAGVKNVVLKPGSEILQRKFLVMGSPLAANIAGVALAVPQRVLSPDDASNRYGKGSMLARLIAAAFKGTNYAVPIFAFPEAEGSAAAAGSIAFVATTSGKGAIYLYIAGKLYTVAIAAGLAAAAIASAVAAAINADDDCPVTATAATGTVTFTAKSKGLYGNGITIALNPWPQQDQALPTGVTATITAMSGGVGVPTVATDLANGLGTGSNANADFFTDVVHGYGQDTTVLDALSAYVGEGNEYSGLYDRNVHRPFRALTGDTATGSSGLTALITLTNARKSDRCNGVIVKPGSLTHPSELAAIAMGKIAAANNELAEANYVGLILPEVDPGNIARLAGNDWAADWNNRDTAVKAGISPALYEDGAVKLQNVVSFFRPATIPQKSNAYREFANLSKIQNILYNKWLAYNSENWKQFSIVSDKKNVTVAASRAKARDKGDVISTELALIRAFAANAWIYDPDYSIKALAMADAVTIREGGDGFETDVPYILSGVGNIIDTRSYLDTSIAVLSAA